MARDHCSDDRLIAFLDGELSGDERRRIARHLELCWRCRPRIAELEEQVGHVRQLFAETEPAIDSSYQSTRDSLLTRCRAFRPGLPEQSGPLSPLRRWPALIPLAGAALALASITTWIGLNRRQPATVPLPLPPVRRAALTPPPRVVSVPRPATPVRMFAAPLESVLTPDLEELEVDVRFVLHRLGADLADPPQITQAGGEVVLRGTWTPEEREQLETALIDVSHPERVRLESPDAEHSQSETTVTLEPSAPVARPFDKELLDRAGSFSRLLAIGNSAVAIVERMTDLAWALRRLDDRYDRAARSRIAPRVLWLVNAMEASYLTALREHARKLNEVLQPLTPSLLAPFSAPDEPLYDAVMFTRALLQWLFAGRLLNHPPATLAEAEDELGRHLNGLDTQVNSRLALLNP